MKHDLRFVSAIAALLAFPGAGSAVHVKADTVKAAGTQAPMFEVDPMWPKPLPNHWILGMTIGVSVDAQDHIWIIHRQGSLETTEANAQQNPVAGDCCSAAPPVLEFDEAGNLIGHWGGPGKDYEWPVSTHGITVDYKGNVWIGGNGNGRGRPNAQ